MLIFIAGTLIFHIGICEPFTFTKLYALEFRRLQPGGSLSGRLGQHVAGLVEECDKIKFLLHTHSFTYDYHLVSLKGQAWRFFCFATILSAFDNIPI
jgi:hypothetical protein